MCFSWLMYNLHYFFFFFKKILFYDKALQIVYLVPLLVIVSNAKQIIIQQMVNVVNTDISTWINHVKINV